MREITIAAGNLLKTPGLVAMAAVFILAAWHDRADMLVLTGLFLSSAGFARLWSRVCLVGVGVERQVKGTRFFPGESIPCRLRLVNRKPLPLAWVELENHLPPGIVPADDPGANGVATIRRSAALLWYRRITWQVDLVARKRGYYPLGPMTLTSGDLLGLYCRKRRSVEATHLIVYPQLFAVDTRWIPSLHPMGAFQAPRRLFQDPTHTIGVRDYQRSDSLKFIHWKATARRGDLQVKRLAATTAFNAALVVDVESFQVNGAIDDQAFELAISSAGSIAAALCRHASPVGLLINTRLADTGQPAAIDPGASPDRITLLLETLAKVTGQSSGPMAALLERQRSRLSAGTTVIFILGQAPHGLAAVVAPFKTGGFNPLVLIVGGFGEPDLPAGMPWRRIGHAGDLARRSPG